MLHMVKEVYIIAHIGHNLSPATLPKGVFRNNKSINSQKDTAIS